MTQFEPVEREENLKPVTQEEFRREVQIAYSDDPDSLKIYLQAIDELPSEDFSPRAARDRAAELTGSLPSPTALTMRFNS